MCLPILADNMHSFLDEAIEDETGFKTQIEGDDEVLDFFMTFENAEFLKDYLQMKPLRATSKTYQILPVSFWYVRRLSSLGRSNASEMIGYVSRECIHFTDKD